MLRTMIVAALAIMLGCLPLPPEQRTRFNVNQQPANGKPAEQLAQPGATQPDPAELGPLDRPIEAYPK